MKKLSNKTQEAVGDMTKVASESLSAVRTVQAYNAMEQEEGKFAQRVGTVLGLARKEAIASGFFFGATGWSGNVTLLGLLGYGTWVVESQTSTIKSHRWQSRVSRCHNCGRSDKPTLVHCICREWPTNADVSCSDLIRYRNGY